ncbi:hypothetical protein [Bradyrhizobium sp. RT10b]|uniref:hypothetical protein n=1 Tax=Bradyrhizobium sp. RT10b TaxID=3156331 RepID=UPI003394FCDF
MTKIGEVKNWNDERGFGFLRVEGTCLRMPQPSRVARPGSKSALMWPLTSESTSEPASRWPLMSGWFDDRRAQKIALDFETELLSGVRRGADQAGLARVGNQLAQLKAELPARIVSTVTDAKKKRTLR